MFFDVGREEPGLVERESGWSEPKADGSAGLNKRLSRLESRIARVRHSVELHVLVFIMTVKLGPRVQRVFVQRQPLLQIKAVVMPFHRAGQRSVKVKFYLLYERMGYVVHDGHHVVGAQRSVV